MQEKENRGRNPKFNRGRKSDDQQPNRFGSGKNPNSEFKKKKFGDKKFRSKEEYRVEKRKSKDEIFGDDRKHSRYSGKPKKSYSPSSTSHRRKEDSDNGLIRLNKYIANAGICSRREADGLISAGVISVNGKVVTQMGLKISSTDEVKFHDRVMRKEKMVYVLLNKPKDHITTTDDPLERKTVMNLVDGACKERIYPVGRLDRSTTGVLMLTNDGDLTKKLTHPSNKIKKVYYVELDRGLKQADFEKIADGVELEEDGKAVVDAISFVGEGRDKTQIGLELHSGKNRIVRRIFEALDYKVRKLDRVMFAGLTKKDLPRGRWRLLTEMEVNGLKMMTGSKVQ